MTETTIGGDSLFDRYALDKEVTVLTEARVRVGDDNTPNEREPGNLNTGVTGVGKRACGVLDAAIGRNSLIDTDVNPDDFTKMDVPSGATITARPSRTTLQREKPC